MKKKKLTFSAPIILLSFLIIATISLKIPNLPNVPNIPNSPKTSLSSSSKFSFRDLVSRPVIHNSNPITLIVTGDIMLGRYCNVQMVQKKDWKYPFLKVADFTKNADITFGNLEAPIVENCPTAETGMIFCARPEAIEGLKFAGFDTLSLANNHILNYGQKGLEQTINLLTKNQILPSAETLTSYKLQANQLKFGFLSFDLITYPKKLTFTHDRKQMSTIELIKDGVKNADILVVSLHWGNEYQKTPTEQQKILARQIIDAGAKVIVGHHPHVTQPVEEYNGGLIFYSLGNFIFDQPWSEETKKGNIAKIVFEGKEIKSYELIPIYIQNFCQPIIN